ncbi:hypothetical protein MP638_005236 [Amoeboaphelidium occidentale]|nr:hypothetical protein MP638_005236 [Amoeboaphelidium occidentale]
MQSRRVEPYERLMLNTYVSIHCKVTYKNSLESLIEKLKHSYLQCSKKHPVLRFMISEDHTEFIMLKEMTVEDLEHIVLSVPEFDRDYAELKYDDLCKGLFRIYVCAREANTFKVILVGNHSVCDGPSMFYLLHDLLQGRNIAHTKDSIESPVLSKIKPHTDLKLPSYPLCQPLRLFSSRSQLFHDFSEVETTRILTLYRQYKISIQAALMVASIKASAIGSSMNGIININVPVNLRCRVQPRVDPDVVCLGSSILPVTVDANATNGIEMGQKLTLFIRNAIDILINHAVTSKTDLTLGKDSQSVVIKYVNLLNSGRYDVRLNTCAFTVSSLGQTVLKKEYDELKLDQVHFTSGMYSENNSTKGEKNLAIIKNFTRPFRQNRKKPDDDCFAGINFVSDKSSASKLEMTQQLDALSKEELINLIQKLRLENSQFSSTVQRLTTQLEDLKDQNIKIMKEKEEEEEAITNRLLKTISNLSLEKSEIVSKMEMEEEYITNVLSKKVKELEKEKLKIEMEMETEQEFIVNRLTKQIDELKKSSTSLNEEGTPGKRFAYSRIKE